MKHKISQIRNRFFVLIILLLFILIIANESKAGIKKGTPINPITDIAWQEVFPIKIAGITIMSSNSYDVPDQANMPVCVCPAPAPLFVRVGIPVSFWEPARLIETVSTAFYFPTLGFGLTMPKSMLAGSSSKMNAASVDQSVFKQAHYMIFPIWTMLELFVDLVCLEHSGFDIAYLTEIDPLWQDDLLTAIIEPEAMLFANPIAQLACIADSVSVNAYAPLDPLFWCIGSSGSAYPLTGHVNDSKAIQGANTVASRMIYKLSRQLLICDTNINLCGCIPMPIWIKSHYKLQVIRPSVRLIAHPVGKSQFIYGAGLNPPVKSLKGPENEFLWLLFRKRSCCVL